MNDGQEFAKEHDKILTGQVTENSKFRSADKIREDIYRTLGDESGIDLEVKNGYVRVTGMVDTEDSISWITERIRNVKGVIDVQNKVAVKPFNH